MATIWEQIRKSGVCEPAGLSDPYADVLLTRDAKHCKHWLIGPHPLLTSLGKHLLSDKALLEYLRTRGVYFGFRVADPPPFRRKRIKSYGNIVAKVVADHSEERKQSNHRAVRTNKTPANARISDEQANVEAYWATQTPQAHHIVEFNNLEHLGVSHAKGAEDLNYDRLPCVLVAAEFHQRYLSSIVKSTHSWHGSSHQILAQLRLVYKNIFCKKAPALQALWCISEIILDEADRRLRG